MSTEDERLDLIVSNLNIFEKGLKVIKIKYHFKCASLFEADILCEDKVGRLVIIEEKGNIITSKEVINQLINYCNLLKQDYPNKQIRGILIAPNISKNISEGLETIKEFDLIFYQNTLLTNWKTTTISVSNETKDKIDKLYFVIKTNIIKIDVNKGRKFSRDDYLNSLLDDKNVVGGSLICQKTF